MDPVRFVEQHGGVATRQELIAAASRPEVDAAVAAGRLVVIRRGRLTLPGLDDAESAARALGGALSGLSAARYWGWSLKREPSAPVVTVPRNRSTKRDGVVVRRQDVNPQHLVRGGLVTSKAQTVLDCARTLPFDEALCVADSALRDGRATGFGRDELLRLACASPRTGRARAVAVITAADARAANAFESVTRAILRDVPGLQAEPQGDLGFSDAGAPQYGDLVDGRLRLLIECESWAYHAGEEPFRRDIRRYTRLVAEGWTVLRFVWEDVMQRAEYVRETVRRVVDRLERHSS